MTIVSPNGVSLQRRARGSAVRDGLVLLGVVAAVLAGLFAYGASRVHRDLPLPAWMSRLAAQTGLVSEATLAEARGAAESRVVSDALWRNEAANRARELQGVRAAAWDGDRLIVMLAAGTPPSGAVAKAVCRALDVVADQDPVRVRVEALDGQGAPVESWCGGAR